MIIGMMELIKYTHKELVEIAYKWVLKNCSVGIAFKELYSLASEIPDVIAFGGWESIVIECKASRSDFLGDMKKPHRTKGMGNWRFYCCPKGMIKVGELPEKWGLIYVNEKGKAKIEYDCRIKKVKEPCPEWMLKEHPDGFWFRTVGAYENKFEPDMMEERRLMYTALRRLFIKGHMACIYDKQYNKNSSVNDLIMLNSDKNDERIATQQASNQCGNAGINK
jgi:hypothetical protein